MWTPVRFADNSPGQWGLGWEIHDRGGHRMVGMTGGGRAAVFLYPDDEIAVVVLTILAGAYPEDFIDSVAKLYTPGANCQVTTLITVCGKKPFLASTTTEVIQWVSDAHAATLTCNPLTHGGP
jgi:hypothetical protein